MTASHTHTRKGDQDIRVLVVSCDAYSDVWTPFFHFFLRYWADCPFPISLVSNYECHGHEKVESLLVGEDVDYSSSLIRALDQVSESWVLLWVDDFLLTDVVTTDELLRVFDEAMKADAGFLQVYTSSFTLAVGGNECSGSSIQSIPANAPYRGSISLGLWKRSVLQRILEPGETIWEIERRNPERSLAIPEKFMCLSSRFRHKPPIRILNAIRKGTWMWEAVRLLKNEGLGEELDRRRHQSVLGHIQLQLYRRFRLWWHLAMKAPGQEG